MSRLKQNQRLGITSWKKVGAPVLLAAFLFFTYESGVDDMDAAKIRQRVKVVNDYSSRLSHGPLKLEGESLREIEQQNVANRMIKHPNGEQQALIEISKIQARKYHQLLDLEERMALHRDDESFPKASYEKKIQRLKDEIQAFDKSKAASH
ncbi:MAG: hypothetical protein MRZ79_10070 [Bacteroidia bacterium]|nr:hypothetical protein [Bacteroidia bacterium]